MTFARQRLGASGEAAAASWYEGRGYTVVARNWRGRDGELDLIVRRGMLVVFCEVKTRSSTRFGVPAEAVTPAKQHRIRGLATQWLRQSALRASELRFDVAAILDGRVEIIEAAF